MISNKKKTDLNLFLQLTFVFISIISLTIVNYQSYFMILRFRKFDRI